MFFIIISYQSADNNQSFLIDIIKIYTAVNNEIGKRKALTRFNRFSAFWWEQQGKALLRKSFTLGDPMLTHSVPACGLRGYKCVTGTFVGRHSPSSRFEPLIYKIIRVPKNRNSYLWWEQQGSNL